MNRRTYAIGLLATLVALAAPATAAADETFHRFEANATANYTIVEQCDDGSTARLFLTVIGGHEEESENGETTVDDDFLTIRLRGQDCAGNFVNDFGTGPADFTSTRSPSSASVAGTITTRDGRVVTVDMEWSATGPTEVTTNTTQFPGFSGVFIGKRRDAVATGTVVVDGETLVDGSTTNAELETLEDRNRRSDSGEGDGG